MVDALDRICGDAQPHIPVQRIGDEGDVAEVRQKPPLGLDVGVADLVAYQGPLAVSSQRRDIRKNPLPSPLIPTGAKGRARGSKTLVPLSKGAGGRIGALALSVKVIGQSKQRESRLSPPFPACHHHIKGAIRGD